MSRRSARNRHRGGAAKAMRPTSYTGTSGTTYSAAQVAEMMAAQRELAGGRSTAQAMPASPFWETSPFGPGRRLVPAPINVPRPDSGRAEPRLWNYPVSWNLQVDDRWHVPWETLRRAADSPLFRKCIERRKSVAELGYVVIVDPVAVAREAQATGSAKDDVEAGLRQKYIGDIARITDALAVPDRKNDMEWPDWCGLLMENRLKYDAAVVYPRRTYGGDLYALEIIDGKTIKPLLDENGGRPLAPYAAYQQILYGFPRSEFTATVDPDDVDPVTGKPVVRGFSADTLYYRKSIYRSESPYGMSATEIALLDGLVWLRRMGWIMSEYTEGVTPGGLVEIEPNDWNVKQWEDYGDSFNDRLEGNTAARQKWPFLPPGAKLVQPQEVAERYKPDYDLFLIKLVCGDFGIPASEVGFTEAGALGASFHEGEEDILQRNVRQPDARWLSRYATRLAIRELGMPAALKVSILGLESEDEAAADATADQQVRGARMTLNEDRSRRGKPSYNFAEADMPMLLTQRGVVFLEGASAQAPPGALVGPAQAAPPGAPQQPGQQQGQDEEDDEDEQQPGAAKSLPSPAELREWGLSEAAIAEVRAYRKWAAKGSHGRPFAFVALDPGDAQAHVVPDADLEAGRVTFGKAGDARPKAASGTGLAGSGTRRW